MGPPNCSWSVSSLSNNLELHLALAVAGAVCVNRTELSLWTLTRSPAAGVTSVLSGRTCVWCHRTAWRGPTSAGWGQRPPLPSAVSASSDLSAPLGVFEQSCCRTFPPTAPPRGLSLALARRHLGCHLVRKLLRDDPTSLTILYLLTLNVLVCVIHSGRFYWLPPCPASVRWELRRSRGLTWSAPPCFQALTQWLALFQSSTYHSGNSFFVK